MQRKGKPTDSKRLLGASLHRELGHAKPFAALLSVPQVILGLLVEPAFSRRAERHGQANGHLRTDARTAIQNSRQGLSTDAKCLSGLRDTHTEWVQAQALDDCPGMGGDCACAS